MRIRRLKREVAALMAIVMACGTATIPYRPAMIASAASQKQVKLNVKSKTLKVGQKGYKLRLVNNKQGWKIKKVSTTNAAVCKPYGRKNKYVLLKGKSEGSATVRVKVTRTVSKKGKKITKNKQLSCKVRVKADTTKPDDTQTPATDPVQSGDVTVSTQEQLEAALKHTAIETLRFQTEAEGTFTIPEADYKGTDLIVDAPNADVVNYGTFKSVCIQAIKDSTWLEHAVGNIMTILAKKARVIVQPGADVNGIAVTQAGANVALEVKGNVKGISFEAPDADAKVSVEKGGYVGDVSASEAAERSRVDVDVNGGIENIKFAASEADVNVSVAEEGTVDKMSLEAEAGSARAVLDVKGNMKDVNLAAPGADINVSVAEEGTVDKMSLDTGAGSARAIFDVKGNMKDVNLAAPEADVNVSVADKGTIGRVLLAAAAGSAKAGLDIKGTVTELLLDAAKADVKVAVNDNGKVNGVTVTKEMNVALTGTAKAAIKVKVSAAATVTASTDVALESSTSLKLILEKGAEGSSIRITGNVAAVGIKVENKTESNITVSIPGGNIIVDKNSNRDVTVSAPSTSGSSSSSGGSSSGGSSSGGSSSGGSSSGGSSSGGSSSGGSSSDGSGSEEDKTDTEPKGILVDQSYLTMKVGEEQTIHVSADPKESGWLEFVEMNSHGINDNGVISLDWIWSKDTSEIEGGTIKAIKPGFACINVVADVVGNDKESPIIFPKQSKIVVVRVIEGTEEAPAASFTLTADAKSIEKGEKVNLTAKLEGATFDEYGTSPNFYYVRTVDRGSVLEEDTTFPERTDTTVKGYLTGSQKGKGEVMAWAPVKYADGTSGVVVSNVIEIEVTDSSPQPSPEETRISGSGYNESIQVGGTKRFRIYLGVNDAHSYSARIVKVNWTSANPEIAKVMKEEVTRRGETQVTGVAAGETTLKGVATIATASGTFTKELSIPVTVEEALPLPEVKIETSVHIVTQGAISDSNGYQQEDVDKPAFEILEENMTVTSADNSVKYFGFNHSPDCLAGVSLEGIHSVRLGVDGYGFVIEDPAIESGTFQVPIIVLMKQDGKDYPERYGVTVKVVVSKNNGAWTATCEVTNVRLMMD